MEGRKEEVPPAYANDMPDLHDEKPTGAIVQEEAVHSVALTEALAAGPKPSIWSKSMLQLYAIMAVGYLVSTLNGYDSSLMGAINAMKSYQNTFGLTGEGSSTGIIFIIYNCECSKALQTCASLYGLPLTTYARWSNCCFPLLWLPRRRLRSSHLHLRWLRARLSW